MEFSYLEGPVNLEFVSIRSPVGELYGTRTFFLPLGHLRIVHKSLALQLGGVNSVKGR